VVTAGKAFCFDKLSSVKLQHVPFLISFAASAALSPTTNIPLG